MHWFYLTLAILFEILGTTSMKLSEGFSKLLPSVAVVVFYVACFGFLTMALKKIEMSLAYATWAGVGLAVVALVGIFVFGESITVMKAIFLTLIVVGVIGLNLSGGH